MHWKGVKKVFSVVTVVTLVFGNTVYGVAEFKLRVPVTFSEQLEDFNRLVAEKFGLSREELTAKKLRFQDRIAILLGLGREIKNWTDSPFELAVKSSGKGGIIVFKYIPQEGDVRYIKIKKPDGNDNRRYIVEEVDAGYFEGYGRAMAIPELLKQGKFAVLADEIEIAFESEKDFQNYLISDDKEISKQVEAFLASSELRNSEIPILWKMRLKALLMSSEAREYKIAWLTEQIKFAEEKELWLSSKGNCRRA